MARRTIAKQDRLRAEKDVLDKRAAQKAKHPEATGGPHPPYVKKTKAKSRRTERGTREPNKPRR